MADATYESAGIKCPACGCIDHDAWEIHSGVMERIARLQARVKELESRIAALEAVVSAAREVERSGWNGTLEKALANLDGKAEGEMMQEINIARWNGLLTKKIDAAIRYRDDPSKGNRIRFIQAQIDLDFDLLKGNVHHGIEKSPVTLCAVCHMPIAETGTGLEMANGEYLPVHIECFHKVEEAEGER